MPQIRIGVVSHGSYNDGPERVMQKCDLTRDKDQIVNFVRTTPNTGGSSHEAYEYVLSEVQDMDWIDVSNKVLVMIGDANPAHPDQTQSLMQ